MQLCCANGTGEGALPSHCLLSPSLTLVSSSAAEKGTLITIHTTAPVFPSSICWTTGWVTLRMGKLPMRVSVPCEGRGGPRCPSCQQPEVKGCD